MKKKQLKPGYYLASNGENYALFKVTKTGTFHITPQLDWVKTTAKVLSKVLAKEAILPLEDV
jgi:hypothetical protein